ncbi:hypothetical protein B0919_11370 [Hymenobacter sp. CRA2]|nr:hypothetical protein B0919_11370 [Hymenobacter sp. CRA2]
MLSGPAALAQTGGVRIGSAGTPDAKAALDVSATDRGLLIPRLTQAQRTAITNPPQGLMVYQTDGTPSGGTQTGFWYYAGNPAAWVYLNPTTTTVAAGAGLSTTTSGSTTTVRLGGTALTADTSVPLDGNDLTFSGTGNVGIGGTTANLPLTVQGNTSNDAVQLRNSGGTNRWHLGLPTNGTSNGLNFAESGVADNRLFLKPGGNVGVSTNDPTARLDVNGSMRVRDLTGTGSRMVVAAANGDLSTQAIPSGGGAPTGAAGGDLAGSYPNPTVGTGAIGTAKLADNAVTNAKVADDAIGIAELSASGTASSTTFLRGDNTWATPASSGWDLNGNAINGNNFIGSTNNEDVVFKRNGAEAFRLFANGRASFGTNTAASQSLILGFNAGVSFNNPSGSANGAVFLGFRAGEKSVGSTNTYIGYLAGANNSSGINNTVLGADAFMTGANSTGSNNIAIGFDALSNAGTFTGGSNVVIGSGAGYDMRSNDNNILLGSSANAANGLYNAYAIGSNASVTQGHSMVLGGLPGTNDGIRVGIGVTAPSSSLQVNGTFAVGVQTGYGGGSGPGGAANGLDQGAPNLTNKGAGYYGLAPTSTSNQHYLLPNANSCTGRVYYLRNNSSNTVARLSVTSGQIVDGTTTISAGSTFDMNATGSSKVVTAISDGTNWIIIRTGI